MVKEMREMVQAENIDNLEMSSATFSDERLMILLFNFSISEICCCLVTKLCPTVYDPMSCSMPGIPVLHCLLEFAQIQVH